MSGCRLIFADLTRTRRRPARIAASALSILLLATGPLAAAEPEPAPPYPSRPPPQRRVYRPAPPPRYHPPPRAVAPPPPLSPLMRAIYAPFYAAGLVVRYGVYYAVVAPLEVFYRTVSYGEKGGVELPPRPSEEKG